ncbi:hypothetical protein BH11PLA2_BH11PLA2_27150 [soil metagenome]
MKITEVRVKLCEQNSERLLAFCSITFDDAFVVRDLKIIEGTRGLFVAMPSRKLTDRCSCGCKNHLKARFCNGCGRRLDENRAARDHDGRAKLHADIAHPIHGTAREQMQMAIVHSYNEERVRAQQPGYVCRYDEMEFEDDAPLSYGGMVQANYKAHGPHAASAATHLAPEPVAKAG